MATNGSYNYLVKKFSNCIVIGIVDHKIIDVCSAEDFYDIAAEYCGINGIHVSIFYDWLYKYGVSIEKDEEVLPRQCKTDESIKYIMVKNISDELLWYICNNLLEPDTWDE